MNIADFYLLRPWWLLALLPALLLVVFYLKQQLRQSRWMDAIDPELLGALLDEGTTAQQRWPLGVLLAGWVLATMALSGPCFEKNNQAALKQADAVVILLDLSPSMLAKDVAPTRLQAAHFKILDLLRQRKEGYTGLVAYSGSAHVVAPLSDDANTVAALVNTLEPGIMPNLGSQVEDAVQAGLQLLENSHFARGRLLLISDGVEPEAVETIQKQLRGKSVELHVIGIGTAAGGPIPTQNGGFVKDENNQIRIFPFSPTLLQQLATENGGQYNDLSTNNSDIAALIAPPAWLAQMGNGSQRDTNHTIENWHDAGYWLILPCLLLALLAFRRGMIACLLPLLFLTATPDSHAMDLPDLHWKDWWQTADQQGASALEKGDNKTAAETFRNPEWKAFAEYQNQQHAEAAKHFSESDSASAHYNRGNALAHTRDFDGAIAQYDQALEIDPSLEFAKENREIVKKLLQAQKQKQNQKQNQKDQGQQDKNQPDQEKKDGQKQDPQQDAQQDGEQKQQSNDKQSGEQPKDQQQQAGQQQQDGQQQPDPSQPNADSQPSAQQPDDKNQPPQTDKGKQADEKNASENKKPAKQSEEQLKEQDDKQGKETRSMTDTKSPADREKQQAAEQWLRRVPDDPGGLLRNKFDYYYKLQQQQAVRERRSMPPANQKETRW